jgi:hypothetical protein
MPDIETPDADAIEQEQTVTEHERHLPVEDAAADPALAEADEGDLAESLREVPLDEDDYR